MRVFYRRNLNVLFVIVSIVTCLTEGGYCYSSRAIFRERKELQELKEQKLKSKETEARTDKQEQQSQPEAHIIPEEDQGNGDTVNNVDNTKDILNDIANDIANLCQKMIVIEESINSFTGNNSDKGTKKLQSRTLTVNTAKSKLGNNLEDDNSTINESKTRQQLLSEPSKENRYSNTTDETEYNSNIFPKDIPAKTGTDDSNKIKVNINITYNFSKIINNNITNIVNISHINSDNYKEIQNGLWYFKEPNKPFEKEAVINKENDKVVNADLYDREDIAKIKEENEYLRRENERFNNIMKSIGEIQEFNKVWGEYFKGTINKTVEEEAKQQNEYFNWFVFDPYKIGIFVGSIGGLFLINFVIRPFIRNKRQRDAINDTNKKLATLISTVSRMNGNVNNLLENFNQMQNTFNGLDNKVNSLSEVTNQMQNNINEIIIGVNQMQNGFEETKTSITLLTATSINKIKETSEKLLKYTCDSLMETAKAINTLVKHHLNTHQTNQ